MILVLTACASLDYSFEELADTGVQSRAERQSEGPVSVSASVPGADETAAIFGVPLYKKAVQPVWLTIENNSDQVLRFAPVGTDSNYFSPLEVAWKHRGPFNSEARKEMEKRFDQLSIPRYIHAGQSVSGFVLTNFRPGIKAFNVDLFADDASYSFTFLVDVPGFTPDYANVDFEDLYSASEHREVDEEELRAAIAAFDCCAADQNGQQENSPINVVLVGEGIDILQALLRGNWRNLSAQESARAGDSVLFDRRQDAIFRYESTVNNGYYEMRLWLAPIRVDKELVWAAELKHVIRNAWTVTRDDPDVDLARDFLMQNMWYAQSLKKIASVQGDRIAPVENLWAELFEMQYFTDGARAVFWLSGDPITMLETEHLDWESPRAQ